MFALVHRKTAAVLAVAGALTALALIAAVSARGAAGTVRGSGPGGSPTLTPIPPESVSEYVEPNGGVNTDTEDDGVTNGDPFETYVQSHFAGLVTINEGDIGLTPPAGYEFLGQASTVTAPEGTQGDPLQIAFLLYASLLPPGYELDSLQAFKDGVLLPDCEVAGDLGPDPCLLLRGTLGQNGAGAVILTSGSSASVWNVGVSLLTPTPSATPSPTPTPSPTAPPAGVQGDVNCSANADSLDALAILLYTAHLPYTKPAGCVGIGEPLP